MIVYLLIMLALLTAGLLYLYVSLLLYRQQNIMASARITRLENAMDHIHSVGDIMKTPPEKQTIKLRCKPEPDCPHCHGRGHIGKDTTSGLFIPCQCCA